MIIPGLKIEKFKKIEKKIKSIAKSQVKPQSIFSGLCWFVHVWYKSALIALADASI